VLRKHQLSVELDVEHAAGTPNEFGIDPEPLLE
jgi:hypothetical protein